MKQAVLLLSFLTLLSVSNVRSQTNDESTLVKNAAMDYVEGWYEGNVERMQRSLHPDLVKRAVRKHPKTGRPILNHLSKTTMIEYTNAGGGKDTPKDKLFYDVTILDIYKGIATVKGVSANYVDYIHLAKWNDKWMIVNVLWDNR